MHSNLNSPSQPVLSLCMIVKDESQNLERCLASAKPYVDEIVVVDTGSQDQTPAIALSYGAKVHHFDWCDDFAAARNYAISLVSGQWILILDADEELVIEDPQFCELLNVPSEVLGYGLIRTEVEFAETDMLGGFHLRLFRNDPNLKYTGRYHEQLIDTQNQNLLIKETQQLKILHYGNSDPQAVQEKTISRDIPLLELMRSEKELSLWLLDCLARNYSRTEQHEKAHECYIEAFNRLLPDLLDGEPPVDFFWIPTLIYTLGYKALEQDDFETARLLCQRGLEWCPNFPPLYYMAGEILMNMQFQQGAIAYFEKCIELGKNGNYYKHEPCARRLMTVAPACSLGEIYLQLRQYPEAIAAFELALSFEPNCLEAQQNLDRLKLSLGEE